MNDIQPTALTRGEYLKLATAGPLTWSVREARSQKLLSTQVKEARS
jgi:hypothetical protein